MSKVLIQVNVGGGVNGKPTVRVIDYFTGGPVADPLNLIPGDRIAWNVQVYVGNTPHALPYEVLFFDKGTSTPNTTFFGKSSVAAAKGGTSHFLEALSLQETIKYSIIVPGLGTILDPEIQTGDGTPKPHPLDEAGTSNFVVTWNIDNNCMFYQTPLGPSTPFPPAPGSLTIHTGNSIQFVAASSGPAPLIQVAFQTDLSRSWASPFIQNKGTILPSGAANPIGPLPVRDAVKSATIFTFSAQTGDGSKTSLLYSFQLLPT